MLAEILRNGFAVFNELFSGLKYLPRSGAVTVRMSTRYVDSFFFASANFSLIASGWMHLFSTVGIIRAMFLLLSPSMHIGHVCEHHAGLTVGTDRVASAKPARSINPDIT